MELSVKIGWGLLALLHIMPALAFFSPSMIEKLYNVPLQGDIGILLVHRGTLFFAVFITAIYAAFDPSGRRLASVILSISLIGFLIVYARSGFTPGSLRHIAIADLIGVGPLIWVGFNAWR